MVVWAMVAQMMWTYEACPNDMIIRIQRGRIMMVQRSHMEAPYMLKAMQEVWELLCTTRMWFIWTVRCSKVFGNTIVHLVESVQYVWMQMVHTLKGRYEEIKGETNVAVLQCLKFIAYWKNASFLTLQNSRPRWCLAPPV